MRALLQSEWRKVATAPGLRAMLPGGVVVTLLFSAMYLASSPLGPGDAGTALSNSAVGGIFALLFGLVSMTSEDRHGTLGLTLAFAPRRSELLLAKAVAAAAGGLAAGVATVGLQSALVGAWYTADGTSIDVPATTWLNMVWGTCGSFPLLAVVGVGLGALLREQTLGIVVALIALLAAEPLITGAWNGFVGPFAAAQSLQASQIADASHISQFTGLGVLIAWGLALLALGAFSFHRHQVR